MKANLPYCIVITGLLLLWMPKQTNAQNLVTNGNFSNGSTGWSTSCTIEINPESVYGGSGSNPVTEIDMERCINQHVCVMAGATYTFSFKASRRKDIVTPSSVAITVKVTGDNSGTQYVSSNKTYTNTTYAYTTETYSFSIPANATDKKVNVSFQDHNNNSTFGVLVDDIDLHPTSTLSINGSGSPTMNVNGAYSVSNIPASGISYSWNFIDHATPVTATTAAPTVKWTTSGDRDITVGLSNGTCTIATLDKVVVVTSLLPVKLTGFTARANDEVVVLNWTTQQENNNRYFIVQRSADGITFDSIGVVTGTNTSVEHTYAFTDKHPANGNNYYRLKQVDYNNQFEYTMVVMAVIHISEATVQLYPNPTHSVLNCNFAVNRGGLVKMQIANTAGMVVLQQETTYSTGSHRATVPVQSLQRGTYYLKLSDTNGMQLVKAFSVL